MVLDDNNATLIYTYITDMTLMVLQRTMVEQNIPKNDNNHQLQSHQSV